MICGYRYRIYPNKGQRILLEKHFGSCRFVFNKLLEIKSTLYKRCKVKVSEFDLNKHLLVLKEVYLWLKEIDSQALQQISKNLNTAYKNFFNGSGFPNYKSKKNHHCSFQIPQRYRFEGKKLLLPKIGLMKIKLHRDMMQGK